VFLVFGMHGQTGSSAPQAAAAASQAAPNGPQPTGAIATIHARSNLVVVDVVVTDGQKNPIHGLKVSDFTLTEDGKPQAIRNFEEHTSVPLSQIKVAPAPRMPPGLFSNRTDAVANGPVNVLLLDYLNTPVTSHANANRQLLEYLDKAPAGTRIAIFGLATQLYMLQGFTSDMTALKAALTSKAGTPRVSDIMTDAVNGGPQGNTAFEDAIGPAGGVVTQEMVDDMKRVDAQLTSEEQNDRAQYTLNAFDQLARYLVGIPGRKNVIWFSGGFPLDVEPNPNERDENDSIVRNDEAVRKTDNLLTRAQIAVYPVDARGLQTDPSASVMNSDIPASPMPFLQQTAQEHETMEAMAEDTGGAAFYNTNGLTQAVSKAIQQGSNYYTLTYTPANMQWDERFRSIKIKVDDPSAKQLTYRNGYYAIDPNNRNRVAAQGAATALVESNTMSAAMMHGAPNPAEILFKVRIRPSSAPPDATVLKSNQSNPNPKVKVEGPFKQFGVDLVPDPHAVNCREGADGNRHCALEMWTFVYNSNGDKLITASNRLHTLLTPADYAKLLSGGMAFHQQVSVPVKGQYYIRTAIHDMVSDNVGTVEVPVSVVARLDPLQQLAAAPTASPDATPAAPAAQAPAPAGTVATP
jgi:VWFA-related protein